MGLEWRSCILSISTDTTPINSTEFNSQYTSIDMNTVSPSLQSDFTNEEFFMKTIRFKAKYEWNTHIGLLSTLAPNSSR